MHAPRQKMPGVPFTRVVALIALGVALLAPVAARADQTWLVVSDIHLDPYDALQHPSRPGSDTNLALFESSLAEMKRAVPAPSVVLLPGDLLAHSFPRLVNVHDSGSSPTAVALATMKNLARRFAQTFPKAQFAIVLGNNDDPCGDYRSPVDGAYLRELAKIWQPLVDRGGAAPNFVQSFSHGGYYTASLPVGGMRLIALNSVYFSREYLGDCKGRRPDAAARELAWLRSTIASTPAGARDVLLMHIPPGYDTYVTERARGVIAWPYYDGDSNAAMLEAISSNADRIAFGVAGHAHRFDFRLVAGKPVVPILIYGALSPVYGNNPTFALVRVTTAGALRDITFYTFDESGARWLPGRRFGSVWKGDSPSIGADYLEALHRDLASTPQMRADWDAQAVAWPARRANARFLWGDAWLMAWCAQTEQGRSYEACAKTGNATAWLRAALAFVAVVLLAVVVVVVILRRRIRS